MEIPRGRLYEMRKEISLLKQKKIDDGRHLKAVTRAMHGTANENIRLTKMLKSVEELRQLVYTRLAPYKGVVNLQTQLIYQLYKELGHTDYSAWFATFKNMQDWEGLVEFVNIYEQYGDPILAVSASSCQEKQ